MSNAKFDDTTITNIEKTTKSIAEQSIYKELIVEKLVFEFLCNNRQNH